MTIAVFTLGGTIAMDERDGVVTRLTGADLTGAIPGLADIGAGLDVRDVIAVPSADLTFAGMLEVIEAADGRSPTAPPASWSSKAPTRWRRRHSSSISSGRTRNRSW